MKTPLAEESRAWAPTTRRILLGVGPELIWNLECWSHVYKRPLDAILDLSASISFIDEEIVEDLGVEVYPFICDVPQCVSFEGTKLTKSVLNVYWVD